MDFTDTLTFSDVRTTSEGRLVASVRAARTGIQVYKGTEVGRPDLDEVRVFRPADEVFHKDSLKTFAFRTVTLGHPAEMVDTKNVKQHIVGMTGDEVARDGDFVRVPMMLLDQAAIDAVNGGVNQLSMGYTAQLDWTDGETPDGQKFDAVQRDLRMNHLAVVAAARGGSSLRIGDDGEKKGKPMTEKTRQITVDSIPVEIPDHAAAVIEKAMKDAAAKAADLQAKLDAASKTIEAKDAEIAKKDAEIDDLKGKQLDEAALDAKVAARAKLVDTARKIDADVKTDGLSDAAIRKAVVVAKFGDDMASKSEAYIDARFDILAEDAGKGGGGGSDPVADALAARKSAHNDAAKAYEASIADMQSRWKGDADKKGVH